MPRTKNNGSDGENNARIKVFYFEAENVSSDLASTITALANAIRTAPVHVVPHPPPPIQIEAPKAAKNGNGQIVMPLDEIDDTTVESTGTSTVAKKPTSERKPFQGKILDTILWDGTGTPFVEYVKQRNPQDTMKKYLVIAAWFKRHGEHEAVNSNLIYNAYRKMGWGASVADLSQPLRDGAKTNRGYFTSKGKGDYAITNIGLDAADKVGNKVGE